MNAARRIRHSIFEYAAHHGVQPKVIYVGLDEFESLAASAEFQVMNPYPTDGEYRFDGIRLYRVILRSHIHVY
jgi:hypothetical protein